MVGKHLNEKATFTGGIFDILEPWNDILVSYKHPTHDEVCNRYEECDGQVRLTFDYDGALLKRVREEMDAQWMKHLGCGMVRPKTLLPSAFIEVCNEQTGFRYKQTYTNPQISRIAIGEGDIEVVITPSNVFSQLLFENFETKAQRIADVYRSAWGVYKWSDGHETACRICGCSGRWLIIGFETEEGCVQRFSDNVDMEYFSDCKSYRFAKPENVEFLVDGTKAEEGKNDPPLDSDFCLKNIKMDEETGELRLNFMVAGQEKEFSTKLSLNFSDLKAI